MIQSTTFDENGGSIMATTIAVVHSTEWGGNVAKCFSAGLSPLTPAITPYIASNADYAKINKAITDAAASSPNLIIAAGGVFVANTAASNLKNSDPQFIFLSGIPPTV